MFGRSVEENLEVKLKKAQGREEEEDGLIDRIHSFLSTLDGIGA